MREGPPKNLRNVREGPPKNLRDVRERHGETPEMSDHGMTLRALPRK